MSSYNGEYLIVSLWSLLDLSLLQSFLLCNSFALFISPCVFCDLFVPVCSCLFLMVSLRVLLFYSLTIMSLMLCSLFLPFYFPPSFAISLYQFLPIYLSNTLYPVYILINFFPTLLINYCLTFPVTNYFCNALQFISLFHCCLFVIS